MDLVELLAVVTAQAVSSLVRMVLERVSKQRPKLKKRKPKKRRRHMSAPKVKLPKTMTEKQFEILWLLITNNARLLTLLTPTPLDDEIANALSSESIKTTLHDELVKGGIIVPDVPPAA